MGHLRGVFKLASGTTGSEGLSNVNSSLPLFSVSQLFFVLTSFSGRFFSHLEKMVTRSMRLSAGDIAMNSNKDVTLFSWPHDLGNDELYRLLLSDAPQE